jgi:2-keto-4-pentenoate hydratase/2-oxohepta-3-ene-1,7-dioic acid hydratase in catechol pathway
VRVAIGLCGGPDEDVVAAVTDARAFLLPALLRLAGATPLAGPLAAVLEGGEAELDRIEAAVRWAEQSGVDPVVDGREVWFERAALDAAGRSGAPRRLRAPITLANEVHCFGDIFLSHLGDNPVPDRVGIFAKLTQDVIGPWDPIVRPRVHEGNMVGGTELTIVIGRRGRYWTPAQARDAIWGYTVLNDVTLRGLHPQLGPTLKAFESSAPLGPFLVPRRHIPDPHAVGLRMRLDGREIQDGNTRDMRFDLFESLAELSNWHTLKPGDVIATGDIGSRENLPPGSVVECEVEGVGVLANPVVMG